MDVPFWAWLAVLAAILVMLSIDLFAHRREHVVSLREAAVWSAIWVALGVGFGVVVWASYGATAGGEYFAGYLIEKSLAVDNVFVWAMIFTSFALPRQYQHKVLFYGVLGALVFRGIAIAGGAALLDRFHWVLYVFGAFLVLTAVTMFRHRHEHGDPSRSRVVSLARRFLPLTDQYHGQRFWVRDAGRFVLTPLFLVLLLVETTDIIFAVDSIPAIFAVTTEPFLVFTSNAFAILGLRAMYFLLADLVHRFVHLKAGLAAVLLFVGVKMLLIDVVKVPIVVSLAVIATFVGVAIVASLRATRPDAGSDADADGDPATPAELSAQDEAAPTGGTR